MRLYLDVCCLNRPYDDQAIDRNRLEAEAVLIVLARVRSGKHVLVSSEAVEREVDACPDAEKAELVRASLRLAAERVVVSDAALDWWEKLIGAGFHRLDALHLACAQAAGCEAFLTTDDGLLKRARAKAPILSLKVMDPLSFVTQVDL